MEGDCQAPIPSDSASKGGFWCTLCAIPRNLTYNWETWREVFIIGFAMLAVLGIAALDGYVFLFAPSGSKELPDSLSILLTLLTGYLFAYIPTSFAASSAEKSRKESDARLQQVMSVITNELIPAINDLREDFTDLSDAMFRDLTENGKYEEGEEADIVPQ
jgi:hypothetical protein